MEFLYSAELTIPLVQIVLLLALSTLALLFGRTKLALLINYIFVLHWGYVVNRDLLVGSGLEKTGSFYMVYFGFGFVVVIFALIGFLSRRS